MNPTPGSLRSKGYTEIAPGIWERGKTRQFMPPSVTADACAVLDQSPARAGDSGRERGSNSKERAAAAPKRIRQSSKPLMNALEAEWFERIRYMYPNYPPVRPQAKRYKIARSAWFKPDFSVSLWPNIDSDGETIGQARETCWEVKGNKGKNIAAQAFPKQFAALRPEQSVSGGVKARSGGEERRMEVYRAIAEMFKREQNQCVGGQTMPNCGGDTTDVHHRFGKAGLLLFDVRHFIPVCRSCHQWIGAHPEEAARRGWLAGKGEWNKE